MGFKKLRKHDTKMLRIILALAWPTMLEQLMQTAVQYVDTAMVGTLGTQATAAVGATSEINWLITSSISALGVGFLAYISQAFGAQDREKAGRAVAQASLVTLLVGALFTVLTTGLSPYVPVWMQVDPEIQHITAEYFFIMYAPMIPRSAILMFGTVLRSVGDSKSPMRIGFIMNVINIILNFILIYPTRMTSIFGCEFKLLGVGMGVNGAALASAISFTIGGILITYALWIHPLASPKGYSLKPDWEILKPCLKVAVPNMLQRFATSLGYVTFAAMINSTGGVSTATHAIANTVESAFYIPGYGMQMAAATLAGNAYGARDNKKLKKTARLFIPVEIILMMISGGLLFVFAPPLVSLFSRSEEVIELGSTVLRMVALSEPFYGFSIIIEGLMQGLGKTKTPFIYNLIGMWGVRMIGTAICTQVLGMGLISAWACMIGHNLMLFVLFLITYITGYWNPMHERKHRAK